MITYIFDITKLYYNNMFVCPLSMYLSNSIVMSTAFFFEHIGVPSLYVFTIYITLCIVSSTMCG